MKALLAVALLWLVLDGSHGEETDCSEGPSACMTPVSPIDIRNEFENADSKAEAVVRLCPTVKSYTSCMNDYAIRCPADMETEKMAAMLNLVNDICDPETKLHQAFVNNIECLLKQQTIVPGCSQQAGEQERLYVNHYKSEQIDELDKERDCLNGYLTISCIAGKVKKTCGREAGALVSQLANRSGYLCSVQDQEIAFVKYLVMLAESDDGASNFMRIFKRSARSK